jgi:prepilin signal peptidase PulO-like enzyme (type II secretory pathway)
VLSRLSDDAERLIVPSVALLVSIGVAACAAAFGWFAAGFQHVLFRTAEQRAARARGRKLLALRVFLTVACGTVAGLAARPDHYAAGPAALTVLFGLVLCVIASTDFDCRLIPDRISLPAMLAALALSWAWPDRSVADILVGAGFALAVALVLVVAGFVFGGALGIGDGKLILLLGLVLGWPAVMSALLYGVVAAGAVAVVLLFRKGRRSTYAYGPYLALGGVIALLWPERFV